MYLDVQIAGMHYLADIHMSVMFLVVDEDVLSRYPQIITHAADEVTVEALAFPTSFLKLNSRIEARHL